jgi:hypothetical protein
MQHSSPLIGNTLEISSNVRALTVRRVLHTAQYLRHCNPRPCELSVTPVDIAEAILTALDADRQHSSWEDTFGCLGIS